MQRQCSVIIILEAVKNFKRRHILNNIKKFLSEVGFEPTPSFEDQNAHSLEVKSIYLLSLAP